MNFIRRFFLHNVDASTPTMQAQIETSADQVHDDVECLETYGIASSPPDEVKSGISGHVGGNADHGIVLGFFDRLFRPKDLSRGDVVVYNKWGSRVELRENFVKINHGGATVTISDGMIVDIDCSVLNINASATNITGLLTNNGLPVGSTHLHLLGAVPTSPPQP